MNKEWIAGTEGQNLKFKRETLLNYGMNRWGLNKAYSVGSTLELNRRGLKMNKTHMVYFEKDDGIHLAISDEPEAGSNITAELNAKVLDLVEAGMALQNV